MSEQVHNREMKQTEEHDPVCGMKVDPAKAAASAERQGAPVYFCSQGCAGKFRAAPEKYAQAKLDSIPIHPAAKAEPQMEYTCAMHPEVKQMGQGSCPKCGMALEPVSAPVPANSSEYTCPCTRRSCEMIQVLPNLRDGARIPRGHHSRLKSRAGQYDQAAVDQRRACRAHARVDGLRNSAFLPMQHLFSAKAWAWIEFALATPVVLWCGLPFFVGVNNPCARANSK